MPISGENGVGCQPFLCNVGECFYFGQEEMSCDFHAGKVMG